MDAEISHDVFDLFETTTQLSPYNTTYRDYRSWEGQDTKRSVFLVLTALLCLHLPLIALANLVVIVTFTFAPNLRTPDNFILVGLAVSDVINGFISIPITVINNFDFMYFKQTKELCYVRFAPLLLAAGFNHWVLTLLTVDRFLALRWPFWYLQNAENSIVIKVLVAIFAVHVVFITVWGISFSYDISNKHVLERCTYKGNTPIWLNTYVTSILFAASQIISFSCTIYVAITLYQKIKDTKKNGYIMNQPTLKKITTNAKITILLMFLHIPLLLPSISLIISWREAFGFSFTTEQFFNVTVDHLRFTNGSLNAGIYALSRNIYKKAYKYILTHSPNKWRNIAYILRENSIMPMQMGTTAKQISLAPRVEPEIPSKNSETGKIKSVRRQSNKSSGKNSSKKDLISTKDRSTPGSTLTTLTSTTMYSTTSHS